MSFSLPIIFCFVAFLSAMYFALNSFIFLIESIFSNSEKSWHFAPSIVLVPDPKTSYVTLSHSLAKGAPTEKSPFGPITYVVTYLN